MYIQITYYTWAIGQIGEGEKGTIVPQLWPRWCQFRHGPTPLPFPHTMLMNNDGSMHVMSTAVHVLMFNIEWGVEDYIIMSVLQQRMILAKLSGKNFKKTQVSLTQLPRIVYVCFEILNLKGDTTG